LFYTVQGKQAGDLPQVWFVNAALEALAGVASTDLLVLFVREDREVG
jgi:hypothetical protein